MYKLIITKTTREPIPFIADSKAKPVTLSPLWTDDIRVNTNIAIRSCTIRKPIEILP